MSKLDDILVEAGKEILADVQKVFVDNDLTPRTSGVNAKEQIKDLFLELIGEELHDCPPDCTPEMHEENDVRNQLKLELRQKVSEL